MLNDLLLLAIAITLILFFLETRKIRKLLQGSNDSVKITPLDTRDDDELYEEAEKAVVATGKASASFLQRKLRIGYARAAALLDMLEENKVVGPSNGATPREVLKEDGKNNEYSEEHAEEEDELYSEAEVLVREEGKASPAMLQRKLRIGYARAASLMDALEEKGMIEPSNGAKPRKVISK